MSGSIQLFPPTFEHHHSGLGVSSSQPRLSWRFQQSNEAPREWKQNSYEVEAIRSNSPPKSAHRASSESVLVPWPFKPLNSREILQIRVRAFGGRNGESAPTRWSPWAAMEVGLLERSCWQAQMITASSFPRINDPMVRPFRLRKTFRVPSTRGTIVRARLYSTAFGVYQPYLNGSDVGDLMMSPGWTSYHHRLNYQIFDVANQIHQDQENVLGFEVAEGWYAGRLGWGTGKVQNYGTDIYDGETYDATEEDPGWCGPITHGFEGGWTTARIIEGPRATLLSPDAPPVRITEKVEPVEISTTPSGKTIVDFGQNLVGKLMIDSISGPSGHKISFIHAEVMENRELGIRPLRDARCTDEIIMSGHEIRAWTPKFTFHGFRYVQIEGWNSIIGVSPALGLDGIAALVAHSDMSRTGTFNCSHPLINQLHDNVVWSMRGNFFSIPTDCPQRDERIGWTGDIQVFAPTGNFLYNTTSVLASWLQDLAAEQQLRGGVPPLVVPNVLDHIYPIVPQAVWGDAAILTPWDLYIASGDLQILRSQYESMRSWLDAGVRRGVDGLWDNNLWQLGDWLDPRAPPDEPGEARTHGAMVADAYLVHVTSRLSEITGLIGETRDSTRYEEQACSLKAAFRHKYMAPSGLLVSDTQTALALAIVFGFYDNAVQLEVAGARLEQLARMAKFRVATGFVGTPIVLHALTLTGREQVAYRMLQEKRCPSWLYPITMGATTIWERWNSMLPDGSINPGEMTSFNHYALGAVANWLHAVVGGIRPKEAGWKSFFVVPRPGGTIRNASVTYESPFGRIECSWSLISMEDGDRFESSLLVPPNSEAWITLPHVTISTGGEQNVVGSGSYSFSCNLLAKDWPLTAIKTYLVEEDDGDVAYQ
ncbi:glycoside hydrolase family 78 protein [Lophiostoma macrostomum CBS 122681]|uniref:alpha-L-rhamnosidase n=1 Tax=Lophiostoma macrostomum CBS 122681 TaxID=1314788 RepID=A0A6A6SR01_9PLEO|nr:glycoside hydrolase family 78 protein [Lophiostoma macrostomum CBS 122681]